jgi:hypothetical protein
VPLGLPLDVYNAVAVERVTGDLFLNQGNSQPSVWISHVAPGPTVTPLLTPPPGGWGYPSGIAVNDDPEAYGPATPGANTYTWALAPNPGGLPLRGNLGFSLTLSSSPSGAPGAWFASVAPTAPFPLFGISVNIEPAGMIANGGLAGTPAATIALPIPAIAGLAGTPFFFQTVHLDPLGLAASAGLALTIL